MAEPQTTNIGLIIPSTGDLVGTWGTDAVNPNMTAIDGLFGGVTTVSLTSGSVVLTSPSGYTPSPGAGPTQSQNRIIILSGSLSGNITLGIPLPGAYTIINKTTPNGFLLQIGNPTFAGSVIGMPPYETRTLGCDGTNVFFLDLPPIGSYWDLGTSSVPAWIGACTVPPYLLCNGSSFSSSTYPGLALLLGGTTLPDARGRVRTMIDDGTGRISTVLSGGFMSGGGDQNLQSHGHSGTTGTEDVPHTHSYLIAAFVSSNNGAGVSQVAGGNSGATTGGESNPHVHGFTTNSTGSGSGQNVQPTLVAGITMIRAG